MSSVALGKMGHSFAALMAKHVTDRTVATISSKPPEGSDEMNQPSIQVTSTHVGLLMPKKWVWPVVASGLLGIGGISIVQFLGAKAGFATNDEVKRAVSESVSAAVKPINDALVDMDRRLRLIELGDKARKDASAGPP